MSKLDDKAKELNALERRVYKDWGSNFEFLVLEYPTNNHLYKIYRWVNCVNGCGSWQTTVGDPSWVEQAEIIETYNKVSA